MLMDNDPMTLTLKMRHASTDCDAAYPRGDLLWTSQRAVQLVMMFGPPIFELRALRCSSECVRLLLPIVEVRRRGEGAGAPFMVLSCWQ